MSEVVKRLHLTEKKFVTSDEIKKYCEEYALDYYTTIRNLTSRGYLLRIFKGVFYVRSFEELKMGKLDLSHLELISEGMRLKGVDSWYFGLYTALKLNNATHEHFTVDYVISDRLFRQEPMSVAGHSFRFVKLKKGLLGFGTVKNRYRYSDIEKTILDLIYIWRYNGKPEEKIRMDLSDYAGLASAGRMREYAEHYPKTVKKIAEALI
jgi:predicted transcriptional regulator of viral defense system